MSSIVTHRALLERGFGSFCGLLRAILPGGWSLLPATVIWEVTHRCNLRCDMCFFYGPHGRLPETWGELTAGAAEAVLCDIKRAYRLYPYRPFIAITGGEPFCRSDIFEIFDALEALDFRYSITTNLALPDEGMLKRFAALRVSDIHVSIDGPEEVHDRIRGVRGVFRRTVGNIELLRSLFVGRRLPLLIKCVINQENAGKLGDVLDIAVGLDADVQFQHLMFLDDARLEAQRAVSREALGEPLETPWYDIRTFDPETVTAICRDVAMIQRRKRGLPVQVTFLPSITEEEEIRRYYLDLDGYKHGAHCSFPWGSVRISPGGDIFHCMRYSCGNLMKSSFSNIQNNERMRRFRGTLKKIGLFPGCVRCCKI